MNDFNSPPPPPPPPPGAPPPPPSFPPPPPGMGPVPGPGGSGPTAKNWMGITGLVTSIAAFLGICCCGIFGGVPLGAAGIVFGLLGRKAADEGEANNRGLGQAAFIIGIAAVAASVLLLIISLVLNGGIFLIENF